MNPLYLYRARCVLYHKLATKIAETASFQKKKNSWKIKYTSRDQYLNRVVAWYRFVHLLLTL